MPQTQLYLDEDMDAGQVLALPQGEVAIYCARCPGSSSANEDAAGLLPVNDQALVLVVADGLGGAVAGARAAKVAIGSLQEALRPAADDQLLLRSAIINGIEEANQAVRSHGTGMATTLAAVEVHGRTIRPYHVGDSMVMVVGQRGKLKLQTVSHSPVGYAIEAGVLDETEAMHHEDRHLVSNYIGNPSMRIEVGSALDLAARDTVLLASDGLFDNLRLDEIVQTIRKGPLGLAVSALARAARQRMETPSQNQPSKPDDLTIVLFRPPAAMRSSSRRSATRRSGSSSDGDE